MCKAFILSLGLALFFSVAGCSQKGSSDSMGSMNMGSSSTMPATMPMDK
jgi:hypothetical protein